MLKNRCVYKTKEMICNRSDNSFVMTKDGSYVRIVQFIVDKNNNREYTVCQNIIIRNAYSNGCNSIKQIEQIENGYIIIETEKIHKICVLMAVNDVQYLCAIPNMYWFS